MCVRIDGEKPKTVKSCQNGALTLQHLKSGPFYIFKKKSNPLGKITDYVDIYRTFLFLLHMCMCVCMCVSSCACGGHPSMSTTFPKCSLLTTSPWTLTHWVPLDCQPEGLRDSLSMPQCWDRRCPFLPSIYGGTGDLNFVSCSRMTSAVSTELPLQSLIFPKRRLLVNTSRMWSHRDNSNNNNNDNIIITT